MIIYFYKNVINKTILTYNNKISFINICISGSNINFQSELGIILLKKNKDINHEDIKNVIKNAIFAKLKDKHKILHIIPEKYILDNINNIKNPLGLNGIKLKSKVNLITCNKNYINNLTKLVNKCNLNVDKILYSGLSSNYVLSNDEKNGS
ncbi:hypothetical protein [Candidatus Nardonella dryophthoridicola]|uniref:hypothetical protein n=1 Tax=Candidatus Nardonella dryophthoridicola TaxID=1971485 RepID=UPI003B96ADB9